MRIHLDCDRSNVAVSGAIVDLEGEAVGADRAGIGGIGNSVPCQDVTSRGNDGASFGQVTSAGQGDDDEGQGAPGVNIRTCESNG